LEALGFSCRFEHHKATNDPAKIPLLSRWEHIHDLAVFDGGNGASLELTVHGQPLDRGEHLGFVPLIRLESANSVAAPAPIGIGGIAPVIRDALGVHACWHPITGLGSGYWCTTGTGPEVIAAIVRVNDLSASSACLIDGLRFQRVANGRSGDVTWELLHFAAPVPRWQLKLLLIELHGRKIDSLTLDSVGFPCLALLTTRLEADLAKLHARRYVALAVDFASHVNRRDLKIAMVRTQGGEIIELIEVRGAV
jgi:hypothetical protein